VFLLDGGATVGAGSLRASIRWDQAPHVGPPADRVVLAADV
jgi:hypothetical protein